MAWKAATLAQLLQRQAPGLNVAVEIRPSERLSSWSLTSGRLYTYQATIAQNATVHGIRTISKVKVADPATISPTPVYMSASNVPTESLIAPYTLAARASVDLVEANLGSFYHDLTAGLLYISLPTGGSPRYSSIYAGFWLYFWPGALTEGGEFSTTAGDPFWPYLQRVPDIQKQLSNPLYGVIQEGGGQIILASTTGNLDYVFAEYTWQQGEVVVLFGGEDMPYSAYQRYEGFAVESGDWDDNQLVLTLVDGARALNAKFPKTLYTALDTTTALTFYKGSSLTGATVSKAPTTVEPTTTRISVNQPKPLPYGRQVGVAPVAMALSASEGIWCLAHCPCHSIQSVTIGTETVGVSGVSSTFDWYSTADKSVLYVVRHGSTIDVSQSAIRVSFSGKKNTDGSLMLNFADIVKDMVEVECGLTSGFDTAALARSRFLANLYETRIYLTAQVTLREVLSNICMSTLAYFFITDAGLYSFNIWAPSLEGEVALDEAWGEWIDPPKVTTNNAQLYQSVVVEYGYDPSTPEGYKRALVNRAECAGTVLDRTVPGTLTGTYQATEAGARVLGARFARFCQQPNKTVKTKARLRPLAYDLLKKLSATRTRLPVARGHTLHLEIIALLREFDGFTASLTLDDQRVIGTQAFLAPNGTLDWDDSTEDQKDTQGFWTRYDGTITDDPASFGRSRWF